MFTLKSCMQRWYLMVLDIQFQLDSGATVNVLPVREYKKVCDDPELKELKDSEAIVSMYNGTEICPQGKRRIRGDTEHATTC